MNDKVLIKDINDGTYDIFIFDTLVNVEQVRKVVNQYKQNNSQYSLTELEHVIDDMFHVVCVVKIDSYDVIRL